MTSLVNKLIKILQARFLCHIIITDSGEKGMQHPTQALKEKKSLPWAAYRKVPSSPPLTVSPSWGSEDLGGGICLLKSVSSLPSIGGSEILPPEIIPFESSFIKQRLQVMGN